MEAQDGVTSKIFMCSFESHVAGFKFHDGLHHLQPMTLVQLHKERSNSFDTNAVAVYIKGEKLGHLERNAAAVLSCLDSKLPGLIMRGYIDKHDKMHDHSYS